MLILALDTSLDACAVAVATGGRIIAERTEVIGRGHAERLMGLIAAVLADAGVGYDAIERIGVTVGPGSFTGIRVGVAAARGLRLALRRPLIGISTLDAAAEAIAATAGGLPILAAWDARRDEVYARFYAADGTPTGEAMAAPAAEVAAMLGGRAHACVGSGAPLVATFAGDAARVVDLRGHAPIAAVARLTARAVEPEAPPLPLYMRPADAKPQVAAGVARA